jgi:hypothetical protein
MTVRLKDLVRLPDGTISTIADLADGGRVEFRKVPNFGDRGVTKYLAELKDGSGAWEINAMPVELAEAIAESLSLNEGRMET